MIRLPVNAVVLFGAVMVSAVVETVTVRPVVFEMIEGTAANAVGKVIVWFTSVLFQIELARTATRRKNLSVECDIRHATARQVTALVSEQVLHGISVHDPGIAAERVSVRYPADGGVSGFHGADPVHADRIADADIENRGKEHPPRCSRRRDRSGHVDSNRRIDAEPIPRLANCGSLPVAIPCGSPSTIDPGALVTDT
jgi:hypothetical protein